MDVVGLLVYLIVWGLVLYILYWAIGKIGLPEPFNKVALVVLVLLTVFVLLGPLTGYVGVPQLRLR
jgi:uncharacterized membrane protein YhdT